MERIDCQTHPAKYRHWRIEVEGDVARLVMDVDPGAGLFAGYELKLNSYDLGVDIELADAVQRLRFEHPGVKAVIIQSGKDRVFCAGANIRMLASASHIHKVNFCKFTNETRNDIEDASAHSGQTYLAAVSGACAGGGYELALATEHIVLTDDGSTSVALPEAPLLAVLPGTGGLTRVTDKRKVRRDRADVFCTIEEGIKGQRAKEWNLVDDVVANSQFEATVGARAKAFARSSSRPNTDQGVALIPLSRTIAPDRITYESVGVNIDRVRRVACLTIDGPLSRAPSRFQELIDEGANSWLIRAARELDDAILQLRMNEPEIGTIILRTRGENELVLAHEALLIAHADNWLGNEIRLLWKRVFKRIDMTSRTLVALIEPGSCFAGLLAEIALAADRSYMLDGQFEEDEKPPAKLVLSCGNFGRYPMSNDLSRIATRFLGAPDAIEAARERIGAPLNATSAEELGLVTFAYDDIDWEDEIRIFLEERANFSP
ncbi:MAG: 2,3-epoxybenzoyl-CoA dihydrolase, partial [Hyphomicrobiaceae bacterium]